MNEGIEFTNYNPPDWDVWFMKQAYLVAEKSKDPSTKLGALLVRDKHIISSGFNGLPIGVNDLPERYNDRETKYKYIVHSESNAVLSAARFGIPTLGTTLYTQSLPCNDCAKSIIQGGISKIVIHKNWPTMHSNWNDGFAISGIMLAETGIEIQFLDVELGMYAYVNRKKHLV